MAFKPYLTNGSTTIMICIKTSIKQDRFRRNLEAVKLAVSESEIKTYGRQTVNHQMRQELEASFLSSVFADFAGQEAPSVKGTKLFDKVLPKTTA